MGYPYQLTEFDIETEVFADKGENILPKYTFGWGQFYTQIQEELYLIDPYGLQINIFNLEEQTFTISYTSIPLDVGDAACIASSPSNIFVSRGINVQIFNLQTKEWSNGPSMKTMRARHSCIVHPNNDDVLYAIGGKDSLGYVKSVERIDMQSSTSEYIGNLTDRVDSTSAVTYEQYIYIIGGHSFYMVVGAGLELFDTVHIVDTQTDLITLAGNRLSYGVQSTAAITVNHVIYAFGGRTEDRYYPPLGPGVDTWMKYTLYVNAYLRRLTSNI